MSRSGPSSAPPADGLSVLSFNTWGIFVAKNIKRRMAAMAAHLDEYDVVCLQELFDPTDTPLVFPEGKTPFKYVRRCDSAIVGSGCAVASRYPVVSSFFVPFRMSGHLERVWEGDAIANKGISVTRIAVPRSKLGGEGSDPVEVVFFNTHLIAPYDALFTPCEKETNFGHRMGQAHQLAQLIVSIVPPGSATPFVLCGDLNATPSSPEVRFLRAYLALHGETTATSLTNVGQPTHGPRGQIDHIIFSTKALRQVDGSVRIAMNRGTGGANSIDLSDHLGVACVLMASPSSDVVARMQRPLSPTLLPRDDAAALSDGARILRTTSAAFNSKRLNINVCAAVFAVLAVMLPWVSQDGGAVGTGARFALGAASAASFFLALFHVLPEQKAAQHAADDTACLIQGLR